MAHHKSNDELRDEEFGAKEHRQEVRDEILEGDGDPKGEGSQDKLREDDEPSR